MPPRRRRNTNSGDVQSELAELRQSNQALHQMMNEILHCLPTSLTREGSDHTTYHQDDFGHDDHSTTSSSVPEPAAAAQWSMDPLARALENSD
nr:hypothetical protein CFP56_69604 [Quercus suber]